MKYNLRSIEDADIEGKRVLIRCDFDVPLGSMSASQTIIADDTRLISVVPTLEYLMEGGAEIIAVGHLGRPDLKSSEQHNSLQPIVEWLGEQFGVKPEEIEALGLKAWKIGTNLTVLENIRFFAGEEENNTVFSERLAELADIYVNEAFSVSHRMHASVVGVSRLLPSYAGFHLMREVRVLSDILEKPKRPLTVIIGGAKIETKLPLVEKMHHFADYVLVGGEIAEKDRVLIKIQEEKRKGEKAILLVADLNSDGTDITPKSLENFIQVIRASKSVIWNGPMGEIELKIKKQKPKSKEDDMGYTTLRIAQVIAESGAYGVIGGGDTVAFLKEKHLLEKFSFVSVGGGAMLDFLAGERLPGLESIVY